MTPAGGQPTQELHHKYSFDDADLALRSVDGTLFHVHSCNLRMVSTVFRDMLDVKRVEGDGPIALEESKEVLETLLDMFYPARGPPSTLSISHFRELAVAADKYDIASVTSALKLILARSYPFTTLFSSRFQNENVKFRAMEEYFLACDLEWPSVADELSSHTLSCDLNSEIALDLLFSADAKAAKNLLSLHRQRKIWLYNAFCMLDNSEDFAYLLGTSPEKYACHDYVKLSERSLEFNHTSKCATEKVICNNLPQWWKLKWKVRSSLECDASGIQFLDGQFVKNLDLTRSPCCNRINSRNEETLREHFQYIVDQVPKTIESFRNAMPVESTDLH